MFEIYTKEVEIKEPNGTAIKYVLRPLSGEHLFKVFDIVKAVSNNTAESTEGLSDAEKAAKAFESLDKDTVSKLHSVIWETLKSSYPKEDANSLDEFASQNLLVLMEPILELNMSND